MKKHPVLKRILLSCYCLCILAGVCIGIVYHYHYTHKTVAAFNSYLQPNLKLTMHYDPSYRYRFHPKQKTFLHPTMAHVKRTINTQQTQMVHGYHIVHGKRVAYTKPTVTTKPQVITGRERIYVGPNYHIKPINRKMVYLNPNYPIWAAPYSPGVRYTSTTNRLASSNQAVLIKHQAQSKHHLFYEVTSAGHTYGWVSPDALHSSKMYRMPFKYRSQLYPYWAPDACEAVSLRMALSVKGRDPKMTMRKFIKRIPRNKSPYKGYNHNPLKYGSSAAIYPRALAKYAHRYDKRSYPRTGITKHELIYELEHGNPIVFEGSYRMKDIDSDHTLVLVGYSQGDLLFADPFYRKTDKHKPVSWVSIKKFTKLFHQPLRGARAVIIK